MNDIMRSILEKLYQICLNLKELIKQKSITIDNQKEKIMITEKPSEKLYRISKKNLGKDLSPTQNELGCAESINQLHKIAFGDEIGGGSSTYLLWQALKKRNDFVVCDYEVGAIIISPTGTSRLGGNVKGHAGVCGKFQIMSNNSLTGLFDTKYTKISWENYFEKKLKFPIYYFRKIG